MLYRNEISVEQPPPCQPAFSKWTICSSECGAGLSSRRSNLNARCEPATETRICQTRRCQDITPTIHHKNQHHLRVSYNCFNKLDGTFPTEKLLCLPYPLCAIGISI